MLRYSAPLAALLCLSAPAIAGQVVFTEVMYHPAGNAPEFVEILNLTSNRFDMAKWSLTGGVEYTFPDFNAGTPSAHFLKEYERIIVSSASEAATRAAYPSIPSFVRVYGPWTGSLNNAGEEILLNDFAGVNQCTLNYGDNGNWPVAADGTGHSIVVVNENRAIDDWRNWRQSKVNGGTPGYTEVTQAETPVTGNLEISAVDYQTAVNYTSSWKFWRATTDPDGANPEGTWKGIGFDDSAWTAGNGFFGHEPSTPALSAQIQTSFASGFLTGTLSYYFRTTFEWNGSLTGTEFVLDQFVDDGVIYWLNGKELKADGQGRIRMPAGVATHSTQASGTPGAGDAVEEPGALSGTLDGQLVNGTNYLCAEVHQSGTASSDVYFGARFKVGVPPAAGVIINEVKPTVGGSPGFVEFYNPTNAAIDLNGWYLSDNAANLTKFKISTPLNVPSMGMATVGFTESGLTLISPLTIYLTQPNGTMKQTAVSISAVPTDGRSVGRKPAGGGQWYLFTDPTPGTPNQSADTGALALKLNEIHFDPSGNADWVEIANTSGAAQPGAGLFVATTPNFSDKVSLPASVPGNGFVSIPVNFPTDGGDLVLYMGDADNNVIEAVELEHRPGLDSIQRFPLNSRDWYNTAAATQGVANNPVRRTEIVFNEIFYDPPSKHTQGEFVELFNRSNAAVNLTGWRINRGFDFDFPAGTTIPANGYLVVAKDPSYITATYGAGVKVVGPSTGRLSNKGDQLRLEDANGNPADTVDYKDGGSWAAGAGGKGSSLELLHPDMDNSQPSAWRASDESGKSPFETYTLTGQYRELRGVPTAITGSRELLVSLAGEGHVVLKNMSLIRGTAPGVNQIKTGDATSHNGNGATGFLCTGTHCLSDTLADGFHLISQGGGDTKANKTEVDVTGIAANDQLTLSFQARWVSGMPLVVMQTWDRSFGKVFRLPIPANLGTPGAANSVTLAAAAPTVDGIRHSPTIPTSTQPVVVTARVSSAAGTATVSLIERTDTVAGTGAWNTLPMNDGGTGGDEVAGDGIWSATVAAKADGTITQFYVQATGVNGQVNECPRDATGVAGVNGTTLAVPPRPAMWIVDNSPPTSTPGTLIQRFIIAQKHRSTMNTGTGYSQANDFDHPRMSNFSWNATVIFNESDVMYNGELRRGGSPWTRIGTSTLDRARWRPAGDDYFRGRSKSGVDNDAAGASRFHNRMARYLMYLFGHPGPDSEFIQQIVNADAPRLGDDQEQTDSDFFERAYGDGGELYEIDDAWYMFDTNAMDDRISADSVTGRWSLLDWTNTSVGTNPSAESPIFFHGNWPLRFPEDRYEYAALSSLIKTAFNNNTGVLATQDVTFREQMERQVDVERMAIYAAVRGYIGDWDNFTLNRGKNGYLFRRPTDGKFEFHHWDSDLAFQNTGEGFLGSAGGLGWTNFQSRPWFRQRFNHYLTELITKYTKNAPRMMAYLDAMNYQAANTSNLAPFKTAGYNYNTAWFTPRETSAINFVTQANYNRVFSISTANNQTVADPFFTLNGAAPSRTRTVVVDQHPEAVCTFVPTTANNGLWTVTGIALSSGLNALTVKAIGSDGAEIASLPFSVTLSVNAPPVAVVATNPNSRRVAANEQIVLDATGSFDPEGTPLNYAWTITPNTNVVAAHSVPGRAEVRFQAPGIYTVSVTVTDGASRTAVLEREITVYNANGFSSFTDGIPLGAQYTVQNSKVRDNFSPSGWYTVEDVTGRLMIQVLEDAAKPLVASEFTHPLVTRDLPDATDFILQTDLTPDTREFGNWLSGLWFEMTEGGATIRYAYSLEGGLNLTVKRGAVPADYTQLATAPVTGSGATLRVRRSGNSLVFQYQSGNSWITSHTQSIPAGSTAGKGGVFVASSAATSARIAFDYLLVADPTATNSVLTSVRITEVMYNPAGSGGIEFIELTNIGTQPVDLNGVYFADGLPFDEFKFPSFMLNPGAFAVVTNVAPAQLYAAYAQTPAGIVFQWSGGSLSNGGEQIILHDAYANIITDFTYDDANGWPAAADGGGMALEIVSTAGDYNSAANWKAGTVNGGTPGWMGTGGGGQDSDKDGVSDEMEILAGTNPSDGNSFFSVTGQTGPAGQKLTWPAVAGRTYHVETSPSMLPGSWTRRTSIAHADGSPAGPREYTVPVSADTHLFYRVVVEMTP